MWTTEVEEAIMKKEDKLKLYWEKLNAQLIDLVYLVR